MNIWHTIVITVKHAVAAVLVIVGLQAAPAQPTATIVDVQPDTAAVTVTTAAEGEVPVITIKTKTQTPQQEPAVSPDPVTAPPEAPQAAPQSVPVPVYIIQQPTTMTEPTPTPETPAAAPAEKYTLEIISPMSNKGLGRQYKAADHPADESNYIELGLVVRNGSGQPTDNRTVTVQATDESQNKTIVGTGNVTKIYVDGSPITVPYYHFSYEFHTPGEHTITFTDESGESKTITLIAD